jgi:hypothetical protein
MTSHAGSTVCAVPGDARFRVIEMVLWASTDPLLPSDRVAFRVTGFPWETEYGGEM